MQILFAATATVSQFFLVKNMFLAQKRKNGSILKEIHETLNQISEYLYIIKQFQLLHLSVCYYLLDLVRH